MYKNKLDSQSVKRGMAGAPGWLRVQERNVIATNNYTESLSRYIKTKY